MKPLQTLSTRWSSTAHAMNLYPRLVLRDWLNGGSDKSERVHVDVEQGAGDV